MAKNIDINFLYHKYYQDNPDLLRIILIHSELVAKKALTIATDLSLPVDREFIYCGAMLHDIGVICCNAPKIFAFGDSPYICHGVEGRKILEKHGLYRLAKVCERHTGAGLTASEIEDKGLTLPARDMLPISLEEKLICYADKFFSKGTDIYAEKKLDEIKAEMKKYGEPSLKRFCDLHKLFS